MASWIFSSLFLLWPLSQLLLFRRWLPLLFCCCYCYCCFYCTWKLVLWSYLYRSPAFASQSPDGASVAAFLLPYCYCCWTFSVASFFPLLAQSPLIKVDKKRPPKKFIIAPNFCNGRGVVSQPIYQVTKLLAHTTRELVFAPIIANLAFR